MRQDDLLKKIRLLFCYQFDASDRRRKPNVPHLKLDLISRSLLNARPRRASAILAEFLCDDLRGAIDVEWGFKMANDPRYRGKNFPDVESDLKAAYLLLNPNADWEKRSTAVLYGWEKAGGIVSGFALI